MILCAGITFTCLNVHHSVSIVVRCSYCVAVCICVRSECVYVIIFTCCCFSSALFTCWAGWLANLFSSMFERTENFCVSGIFSVDLMSVVERHRSSISMYWDLCSFSLLATAQTYFTHNDDIWFLSSLQVNLWIVREMRLAVAVTNEQHQSVLWKR